LFEINRLIEVNFWRLIDYNFFKSVPALKMFIIDFTSPSGYVAHQRPMILSAFSSSHVSSANLYNSINNEAYTTDIQLTLTVNCCLVTIYVSY